MTSDLHRRIIAASVDEARRDGDVIGVLLTGSVARGDAHPGSDLDLRILLRSGCARPFSAEVRRGLLIEQGYADEETARTKLVDNPMEVYAYLDGRLLYDPEERLRQLLAVAREQFQCYRTPPAEAKAIAHWLRSARIKIAAARRADDQLKAGYVASTTSWKILEGLWAANDRPMPPSGAVWAHLADLSAGPTQLETRLRELFTGALPGRLEAAIDLMDWIIPRLSPSEARQHPLT